MEKQQVQYETKVKTMEYVRWGLMVLYASIYSMVSIMLLQIQGQQNHTFMNYCIIAMAVSILCMVVCVAAITAEKKWIMKIPKEKFPNKVTIKMERRIILFWMIIVIIFFFVETAKLPNINIAVEHEFIATFVLGMVGCIVMVVYHHIRHRIYHPKEKKPTSGYWI